MLDSLVIGVLIGAAAGGGVAWVLARRSQRRSSGGAGSSTEMSEALASDLTSLAVPGRKFAPHDREILRVMSELSKLIPEEFTDSADFYSVFERFTGEVNAKGNARILEIGGRSVSNPDQRNAFEQYEEYIGIDIHPGENVDVVADAHQLSRHFPPESFDAVFSSSVFEHLAMPWKVVMEVNRVLKPGGLFYTMTHPTWPAHERPWDFWRFNDEAFRVLLNQHTGFEIEALAEGIPSSVFVLYPTDVLGTMHEAPAYLGVAVLARKTGDLDPTLRWDVQVDDILTGTYPQPKRAWHQRLFRR